ncbi:uncharacterized protein BYT42DRAFT_501953, partial [Radiomyces spectabilis]|uniref:uncharacterized protein n=1 Tax=Radiomyces spectabilis TaxID=64574 RepID=UPI002220F256
YFSEKSTVTVTLGVDTPGTVELPMLEAISLESTMKNKRGFVFHTGGSVRGLDFVPKPSDTDFEYLAVGGYNEKNERHFLHEKQEPGSYHNCIQIWRADLQLESERSAIMLDMCILHDFGVVQDLKWCLFGGYREVPLATHYVTARN